MPIQFTCPHCRAKTQVADQYAGQSGPCAACGKTVTVPYPGSTSSGGGGGIAVTLMVVLGLVVGLMVLCVVGAGALFFVGARSVQTTAVRSRSMNNLKQIGLALHNYHDTHGMLPPAYVTDKDGKKLYSWRVLILPYIEENGLYQQFNKDEPWDSPTNFPLSQRLPMVFRAPNSTRGGGTTDYAAIVGAETIFDPNTVVRMANISDGTSNTIMAVEVKGSTINWAEPRDLEFSKSSFIINAMNDDLGSDNATGCNVLLADGSVRFLKNATPPPILRFMTTKSGSEIVNMDSF